MRSPKRVPGPMGADVGSCAASLRLTKGNRKSWWKSFPATRRSQAESGVGRARMPERARRVALNSYNAPGGACHGHGRSQDRRNDERGIRHRAGRAHHHRPADGPRLRAPHRQRHDPRHRPAADQDRARGLRPDVLRPGLPEHGLLHEPRSPTSTARRGSCATAAIRSSSSPRTAPTSRWRTCFSTASCPTRSSTRSGSTTSRTTR